MPHALLVRLVRALLLLEALTTALWMSSILSGLAARDGATILLILLRGGVAVLQLIGFMLLVRDAATGRRIAIWSLALSAALIAPELGWRLTPTNTDPTYRWPIVVGYWVYATAAILILKKRGR
jgi:hypothetical protein